MAPLEHLKPPKIKLPKGFDRQRVTKEVATKPLIQKRTFLACVSTFVTGAQVESQTDVPLRRRSPCTWRAGASPCHEAVGRPPGKERISALVSGTATRSIVFRSLRSVAPPAVQHRRQFGEAFNDHLGASGH